MGPGRRRSSSTSTKGSSDPQGTICDVPHVREAWCSGRLAEGWGLPGLSGEGLRSQAIQGLGEPGRHDADPAPSCPAESQPTGPCQEVAAQHWSGEWQPRWVAAWAKRSPPCRLGSTGTVSQGVLTCHPAAARPGHCSMQHCSPEPARVDQPTTSTSVFLTWGENGSGADQNGSRDSRTDQQR